MTETKIQWTDFSANPIRYRDAAGKDVWACVKCSPGCAHCYSETIAKRYGRGGPFSLPQLQKVTPYFSDAEARKIIRSKKLAGKRVFIGDMTDVFGEWVPFGLIDKLFAMFALRPDVTFQVLTKRPERMVEYLNRYPTALAVQYREMANANMMDWQQYPWPLPNVWLGTSVEDRKRTHERIPHLLACPAVVRFLSAEPLLGDIDLLQDNGLDGWDYLRGWRPDVEPEGANTSRIDWVIVGGESGGGARPFNVEWARSIVRQCRAAGVPVFIKQFGANVVDQCEDCTPDYTGWPSAGGPINWDTGDIKLKDHKGGDMSEWPMDLRVREMPATATAAVA
jgi:protein gp37